MLDLKTPGLYQEEVFPSPVTELRTGVPAFLGFIGDVPENDEAEKIFNVPQAFTLWPQFEAYFRRPLSGGYLAQAVRGFFENGGSLCYVVRLDPEKAYRAGLEALESLDTGSESLLTDGMPNTKFD